MSLFRIVKVVKRMGSLTRTTRVFGVEVSRWKGDKEEDLGGIRGTTQQIATWRVLQERRREDVHDKPEGEREVKFRALQSLGDPPSATIEGELIVVYRRVYAAATSNTVGMAHLRDRKIPLELGNRDQLEVVVLTDTCSCIQSLAPQKT